MGEGRGGIKSTKLISSNQSIVFTNISNKQQDAPTGNPKHATQANFG